MTGSQSFSTDRPHVLIVGDGGRARRFVYPKLAELGVDVTVISPNTPNWLEGLVTPQNIIEALPQNYDGVRSAIEALGKTFDGVGTYSEVGVRTAAMLAQDLNLPGPSLEAVNNSSLDKERMLKACSQGRINLPNFCIVHVEDPDAVQHIEGRLKFPIVLKPTVGHLSMAVRKVLSPAELLSEIKTVQTLLDNYKDPVMEGWNGKIIAQEFIPGEVVFAIDGIVDQGKFTSAGITEYQTDSEFAQFASIIPATLSLEQVQQAEQMMREIVKHTGFNCCGVHCEFKAFEDRVWLIEVAARLPGGKIIRGYEHANGSDLVRGLASAWVGDPADLLRTKDHFVFEKVVVSEGPIQNVEGIESASEMPGVIEIEPLYTQPEAQLYDTARSVAYYYSVEARSLKDLHRHAAALEKEIKIQRRN